MKPQSNPVVAATKLVPADFGKTPPEVGVELGGTLEFRNHSREFPEFEIEFEKPGPPCATDKLTGTVNDPIIVHMPGTNADFYYHVVYKKADGTRTLDQHKYLARTCPGCGR